MKFATINAVFHVTLNFETFFSVFIPQPFRALLVFFSTMASGWAGGLRDKVCPGCISETARCKILILGRDIGWGYKYATSLCNLELTLILL